MARPTLVVGAARSGVAVAAALAGQTLVRLHDARPELAPEVPASVEVVLGAAAPERLLAGIEELVKSPGVPGEAPIVAAARERGIPVISEVEFGYRLLPAGARLVGVTGTNGKTTTTELTAAMIAAAGIQAVSAGNVGRALTAIAGTVGPRAIVVCELSSFQLEDVVTLRCTAAALLNVTPDHLDRHGTLAEYARCKLRAFEQQRPGDVAVLNDDDAYCAALADVPGAGMIVRVRAREADPLGFAVSRLRGDHNRENVAVAAALARAVGADDASIARAVAAFRPVPHRLELVGERGGVTVWNDSKATNVDATLKALAAFPEGGVRIILGGSDKGSDFSPLAAALRGIVVAAYLTGPAGERMRPLVDAVVATRSCGTVEVALATALADAQAGEAIVLAPACASFDQFTSYEQRGDTFRALALAAGVTPAA